LYRQTRLLGLLLLLQVVAMVGLGVWLYTNIDWSQITDISGKSNEVVLKAADKATDKQLGRAILFTVYFFGPVVLLFLSGLGFVLLRRRGWMLASVGQALIMLASLFYYCASRPWYVYPIIAYCIMMILLLNSRGVRAVVGRRRLTRAEARAEIAHGE
jgi:hypothetical protein